MKERCPMCGADAKNSIVMWGVKIIGCECVGNRHWMTRIVLPVAKGDRLAFYNTEHGPGDEDRS